LPRTFAHVLTLPEGSHILTLTATSSSGVVETLPLRVLVDTRPPQIQVNRIDSPTTLEKAELAGEVSEEAVVTINGEPVELEKKQFAHIMPLREGENMIVIRALDSAGNRSEKTMRVFRDSLPPKIGRYIFSAPRTSGGEILTCQATATDMGTGLARTGIFEVQIGQNEKTFQGVMTLDTSSGKFSGSVFIPPQIDGPVKLRKLQIRDRLGNEALLSF
jgi:hypothetical protein